MKKTLCQIIITFTILFYSCKEIRYTDAIIIDSGLPDADGCGYLVEIGTTKYSPRNLSEKFKINNLAVKVSFELEASESSCSWGTHYNNITINKIKKR